MSASDASDSPCWELVPNNALQTILQFMDVPDRLGVASLVCKRWAAVARRCDIWLAGLQDPGQVDGVLEYLGRYGDSISRLELAATQMDEPRDFLELGALPQCSNLRKLDLTNFRLLPAEEQDAEGAAAGVLSAVLTRLSLANVFLTCGEPDLGLEEPDLSPGALSAAAEAAAAAVAASFRPIQCLTGLQELSLWHVLTMSEVPTQYLYVYQCDFAALPVRGEWLAALTRLSRLSLVAAAADPCATLQHISRLTGLRDLHLAQLPPQDPESDSTQPPEDAAAAAAGTFAGLGQLQQLTSLSVNTVQGTLSRQCLGGVQGHHPAQPSILTTLLHLQLGHVAFEPALIAGMPQLTFLLLSEVTWVVSPADFLPASHCRGCKAPPAQGRAAYKLLQLLPSLQQLRRLMLDIKADDWPQAEEQLPAYAALTSIPRLQHLDLQRLDYPLPAAAWKHIFRKELQLPAIAGLTIRGVGPESCRRRVLGCCPAVEAGLDGGRSPCPFNDSKLEHRGPDPEEDGVTLAQLRLLEVGDDDAKDDAPAGVPAVLGALTHLEVVFQGEYHGWGVHGCSEAELRKGKFLQQRRFKRKFRIR